MVLRRAIPAMKTDSHRSSAHALCLSWCRRSVAAVVTAALAGCAATSAEPIDEAGARVCDGVLVVLETVGYSESLVPAQCESQPQGGSDGYSTSAGFVIRFDDYLAPLVADAASEGSPERLRRHLELFPFFLLATSFAQTDVRPSRFGKIYFVMEVGAEQVVYEVEPADLEELIAADSDERAMELISAFISKVIITS